MEFISPDQLQKYEDIIHQINCEYQRHEELKRKVVDETNNITIINLSSSKLTEKISHVELEIYSDITDLLDVYSTDIRDIDDLLPCGGTKYCLVKVYITTALLQKLGSRKWLLNLCLHNNHVYVAKTVHLVNKMPIIIVLPIDENIINCTLECNLTGTSNGQFFVIELSRILIDISFHFRTYKKNQTILGYKLQKILQILKSNSSDSNLTQLDVLPYCEYSIISDMQSKEFKQNLISNCYHNLGIDQFLETGNGDEVTIQLAARYGKLLLTKTPGKLHIKSNINDLYHLKLFFNKIVTKSSDKKNKITLAKVSV